MSTEVTVVVWTNADVSRSTAYDAAVAAARSVTEATALDSVAVRYDVSPVSQADVAAAVDAYSAEEAVPVRGSSKVRR